MDWIVGAAAIAQIFTAVAAVAAVVLTALANYRLAQVEEKQDEQHLATNSRLDELVKVSGQKERAEGVAEGLEQGRQEAKP